MDVHLDCRGEGTSNRSASNDESVETGDVSIEAVGKYSNNVYNVT